MDKNYKRLIGPISMLLCSVTTIIGSGWLFSGYYSSQIAGPSALVSWLIGALLILIVAFTFVELSTMLAVPGGSSHFPHITHGSLVSIVLGWISWLSVATLPPVEVQAVLQYASFFFPKLVSSTTANAGSLSGFGLLIATILMIFFSIVNIYSLRWVLKLNNMIALWKIVIPFIAAISLIAYGYKSENFTSHHFFTQGWRGVFQAISVGGIVFAFSGFKTVIEMAGEANKPTKTIPIALIGSVLVCMLIYIILQFAFLGALPTEALMNGWDNLNFSGGVSPLVTLLVSFGSVFVLGLLYIDTIVAPMGAGLVYVTTGGRILQAMGQNQQMPNFLEIVNTRGVPANAILLNFIIGMLFFIPFSGWQAMMTFITSLMAFSYALGPVCVLVLRYQLPNHERKFKLPYVHLWSYCAFVICTSMCYWTGWLIISKLILFLAVCLAFTCVHRLFSPQSRLHKLNFKPSIWLWFYFAGLILISYLGGFGGGLNVLKFGPDFVAIAVLALFTLILAIYYRENDKVVYEKFKNLNLRHKTELGNDQVAVKL